MKNPNELIKEMLIALNGPRNDRIPAGWFRRRDIERVMKCSEPHAIRHIRVLQKIPGFKTKSFWIDGKKVPFYRIDAPHHQPWTEQVGDFAYQAPTGEQTNPTKPSERTDINDSEDYNYKQF